MYDTNGNYLKKFPITNMTVRTGYLAVDNNIDHITQGMFRQGSGKIDNVVDPDVSMVSLFVCLGYFFYLIISRPLLMLLLRDHS